MATVAKKNRVKTQKSPPGMSAPQTPQNEPGASEEGALPKFMSPARNARIEEKHELQTLNHRLEFYILQNREAQAQQTLLSRELNTAKARGKEELERQRGLYQKEIEQRRKERDALSQEVAALKTDHGRVSSLLDEHKKKLETEEKRSQLLELRTEGQEQRLEDLKACLRKSEQERERAQHDSAQLQLTVERLEADLEDLRVKYAEARTNLNNAEANSRALEEDLGLLRSQYTEQADRDRKQIEFLSGQNEKMEKSLRDEFTSQLNEILQERLNQYEREKASVLAELKSVYDEKIGALRDKIEQQQHAFADLEARKKAMEDEFHGQNKKFKEFQNERESMKNRIDSLNEQLEEQRSKPDREIKHLKDIVVRMKDAYKRKEAEFDSLMDIKIALAMEIKAYRMMLESEEARLGYTQGSGSKRRRADSEGSYHPSSSNSKMEEKADTPRGPSLLISSVDIDGGSLTVRNCMTQELSLNGWTINNASGQAFEFPEGFCLAAGTSVKILANPKDIPDPPRSLAWKGSPWDVKNGDKAALVSPSGEVVSTADILETQSNSRCAMM